MTLALPLWLIVTVLWLAGCAYWLRKPAGPYGIAGAFHLLPVAALTVLYLLFWVVSLALR